MKKVFSVLSLFLAVLTCGSVFFACQSGTPVNTDSKDTKEVTTVDTVTEAETEPEDTYYVPQMKYGGDEFVILCPGKNDNEWECKDFYTEEDSDDPVVSAVYKRKTLLEDKFGVNITVIEDATRGTIGNLVKKDITSGDKEYDIVMQVMSNAYTLAQSGYLINMDSIPYVDLKSDVWDQSYLQQSSIGGLNYFATGEITTMDNDATWVMMFNKKLANNLDLDIYSLVKEGKWTFDKLYELAKDFYEDVNNDAKADEKDKFGIATTVDFIQGLFYAADGRIIKKDNADIPYLDFNNERNSAIIDKIISIYFAKNKVTFDCHDFANVNPSVHLLAQAMFEEDRALFYSEVMQCAIRLREMETDYGIIPCPKFDESQKEYTTHSVAAVTLCAMITANLKNDTEKLERAGMMMQALAVEGKNILTPAYYEKSLKTKGARDAESYDMLPIIFANRTCDIGYMAEENAVAGLYTAMRSMVKKGTNDIASTTKKNTNRINKALTKLVEDFEKLK
ncbi:MAG: extracellular solute-binding protein [Clostridia bacterium]|nr:extracellular solute-binding protein [Clostridia bacterium]